MGRARRQVVAKVQKLMALNFVGIQSYNLQRQRTEDMSSQQKQQLNELCMTCRQLPTIADMPMPSVCGVLAQVNGVVISASLTWHLNKAEASNISCLNVTSHGLFMICETRGQTTTVQNLRIYRITGQSSSFKQHQGEVIDVHHVGQTFGTIQHQSPNFIDAERTSCLAIVTISQYDGSNETIFIGYSYRQHSSVVM